MGTLVRLGVSKKTEKPIKPKKKKTELWKKTRLEFKKNRPVQFDFCFISLKLKNRTIPKSKKTEPNQKKLSQTETGRFEPVLILKKKPNWKWSPSNTDCSQTNSSSRITLSHTHVFKRPQIYDLSKLTPYNLSIKSC